MAQRHLPHEHISSFDPDAQAKIAGLAVRETVVDTQSPPADIVGAEREWQIVTEHMRRSILTSPAARAVLVPFVKSPVSSKMPAEALNAVAGIAEIAPAVDRAKRLKHNSGLPTVPDEAIPDDFLNGAQQEGWITWHESELELTRYRQARDVKMLGFMSELVDSPEQPGDWHRAEDGTVSRTLGSGTKMIMTEQAHGDMPALLDPTKWEKRRQIKDRVYAVTVEGKEYILKERKTRQHKDTGEQFTESISSAEEFAVARKFAERGTIRTAEADMHWEKPLGYVEFPDADGYSFCLYESEDKLDRAVRIDNKPFVPSMAAAIIDSRELYGDEYNNVRQRAAELTANPDPELHFLEGALGRNLRGERSSHRLERLWARIDRYKGRHAAREPLSFEQFAFAKATALEHIVSRDVSTAIHQEGYVNTDSDGYQLRVTHERGNKPRADVMLFDFERYYEASAAEQRWPGITEHYLTVYTTVHSALGYNQYHPENTGLRPAQLAALAVLLTDARFRKTSDSPVLL
ncbi:MAG: hypothetical protein ACREGD_05175 [Candidatus Saccharimonadales bacterium]